MSNLTKGSRTKVLLAVGLAVLAVVLITLLVAYGGGGGTGGGIGY